MVGSLHLIFYFQFLRGSFIPDDLCVVLIHTPTPYHPPLCLFKIVYLFNFSQKFIIIGASCYPAKGIPEPVFKSPWLYSPLTAFLSSISFWCTFVFYSSWK